MKSGLVIAGAALFIIISGFIHLAVAPQHWSHAPAHGWFHILSGIAEFLWGILFWRQPSLALFRIGMVMAGGLIVLWLVTRILPAPFTLEPEEVDGVGILSKLSESMGIAALVLAIVSNAVSRGARVSAWRTLGILFATAIAAGGLTYAIAITAEPLFPGMGEEAVPAVGASEDNTLVNTYDIQLVTGGIALPYTDGDAIPVAGDVMAKLTLGPGDTRHSRRADVFLYQRTLSEPVNNAAVQATAHMRYMDHGTFRQVALSSDDGHYILPLEFPMPGEWELDLEITARNSHDTLHFDLNLFD